MKKNWNIPGPKAMEEVSDRSGSLLQGGGWWAWINNEKILEKNLKNIP